MNTQKKNSSFPASRSLIQAPRSAVFAGIEWLGERIAYPEAEKRGDTFPITWAADDNLYTAAGDPVWGESPDGLDVECFRGEAPDYHVTQVNAMPDYRGFGGAGPKPTGMLALHDKLYLGVQNSTGKAEAETNDAVMNYGHGYDAQIFCSSDYGQTWTPDITTLQTPMFPGRLFGAPAFVNVGKHHAGAPDDFIYVISGEGWDNGNACRLARVPADRIMERAAWEWVNAFTEEDAPIWSHTLEEATPVLSHPGYLGTVEMVYLASLQRYLLFSWHHKVKACPETGSELVIYDAPQPWGPFTLVHHEDPWETIALNPYNPRLPLKWFDQQHLEGWLLFSGSWTQGGQTPAYRSHVRKFKLLLHS